jgi:hypothetical protein
LSKLGGKLLQILPGWSSHEDDERQTHRDTETEGWGFGLRALFLSQVEEMATTRSLWEMRRRMESSQSRVHGVWVWYVVCLFACGVGIHILMARNSLKVAANPLREELAVDAGVLLMPVFISWHGIKLRRTDNLSIKLGRGIF